MLGIELEDWKREERGGNNYGGGREGGDCAYKVTDYG